MIAVCHPTRFAQARGLCKACYDKQLKLENPGYKTRQAENTRRWIADHPAAVAAIKARRAAKLKADPLYRRELCLVKKYGMTLADYDRLLESQVGGCALCGRKPGRTPLHVDHDHTTGRIRGILCHQCNWYLGVIEQDRTILWRIMEYLGRK
jgi:hypothetical protein